LPAENAEATGQILAAACPEASPGQPPDFALHAQGLLTAYLAGEPQSFDSIPLDGRGLPQFSRRVYHALRQVERGRYITYGELAKQVGSPGASRAVGRALARNPFPVAIPCHRVVPAQGGLGGFSAPRGQQAKVDLLALEGVVLPRRLLGLGFEPALALEHLKAAEPMASLIARVGPPRLRVDPLESPFEALAKAIVYQQLAGRAAQAILRRIKVHFDGALPTPERLLAANDDELRQLGLSRNKAAALKDLAAKTVTGVVPDLRLLRRLDDEALVTRLTSIRGIGRWTVEMLLIFRLGRADVFPVDDFGVRKGMARLMGHSDLPKPKDAAATAQRWRPFRTLASWYLWRAAD
jgi:methylated-DNA-[protein]-cysteine S-methyltransferase